MAENNDQQRKRSRVTNDPLDLYTSDPMSLATLEELDEIKAEQIKSQELINALKKDNILLQSQLKALKNCHEVEILSKNTLIKNLIAEKAEAKARVVEHMKANKETTEAFEEAKSGNTRKMNEWESRERKLLLEIKVVREEYNKLLLEKEKEIKANHLEAKKSHKGVKIENKRFQERLTDTAQLIHQLKTHVDDLSQAVVDNNTKHNPALDIKGLLSSSKSILEFSNKIMEETQDQHKELQLLSQNSNVREKVGVTPSKEEGFEGVVLQLLDNPDTTKRAARIDTVNRLKEENRLLLRERLSDVEDPSAVVSLPKVSITNLQKDMEELHEAVKAKQKRIDRLIENWKVKNEKQLQYIQDLLGYKLTFRANDIIQLESIFVPYHKLTFYVNMAEGKDEAKLKIMGTMKDFYMDTLLGGIYESFIKQDKNIPAFMNAAGQELYIQHKMEEEEKGMAAFEDSEEGMVVAEE
ncbi:unnamed protein product [Rhizopus stolonifer]